MSDVALRIRGLAITCSSAEEARDLLIHLTGTQRLAVVERGRVRRSELPSPQPKTLEDVARRHATPPVRIAENLHPVPIPGPTLHVLPATVKRAPAPPPFRPIAEHLRGEDATALSAPAPRRRGRPPRSGGVQPGQLSRPRHDVRGADLDEGGEERAPILKISDRIVRAFAKDEHYPLPRLAGELFGEETGRALKKVKLALEQLVAQRRLLRTGAGSWQPLEQDDEDDDQEDAGDDESTPFDTADERPTALDDATLSELGLG